MANKKQLDLLRQNVEGWNKLKKENPLINFDLSGTDLSGVDLSGANLRGVDLLGVNLNGAVLLGANLRGANLREADLREADLFGANLREASIYRADLSDADLNEANLTKGSIGGTIFGNNNLRNTTGLETIEHFDSSTIGTDTLQKSQGKIPFEFLRGCGLSDWEIASAKLYTPNLSNEEINMILYEIHDLRTTRPVQISPLFISYSHADTSFVDALEKKLIEYGIRFWRDIHDAKAGRLETQVGRAIRHNPTVLLILSENSTKSDWVEHEVRLSRKLEKEIERDVLCPIALDESWKTCKWPERVMEQVTDYNILDFSKWEDDDEFDKAFDKLIQGLDLFYRK